MTGEAVRKWELSRVPAERCREIVRIVNERQPGAISLSDLREDLWPTPTPAPRPRDAYRIILTLDLDRRPPAARR
ncbi:MAG: helix-turn-helix domain-containing protein [Chromatiales bacterium]|nr:helix-turn-helix domain-containing protein [Chromatiales bacterium]MCK7581158.1 helix-turn-helix domain-containing protein [Chromatiales bacterium]